MKVGDKVKLLEGHYRFNKYGNYIIIQIIKKKYYNLYLCQNLNYNYKTTFTDLDLYDKVCPKKKVIFGG